MEVSDILERVMGPLLFVFAISVLMKFFHVQEAYLQDAKSLYLEDDVYQQKSSGRYKNDECDRSELIGILTAHPSVSVKIEDPATFLLMSVKTSDDASMEVTVTRTDSGAVAYHEIIETIEGFPKEYIPYGKYGITYEYDDSGVLRCVTYTKVGG